MGKLCYKRSDIVQRAIGSLYYREDVVASELWQISLPFVWKKKRMSMQVGETRFLSHFVSCAGPGGGNQDPDRKNVAGRGAQPSERGLST